MRPQVPTSNEIQWAPLSRDERAQFAPQLAAGLKWFLSMLEESERARRVQRTTFDVPVQERMRKAS